MASLLLIDGSFFNLGSTYSLPALQSRQQEYSTPGGAWASPLGSGLLALTLKVVPTVVHRKELCWKSGHLAPHPSQAMRGYVTKRKLFSDASVFSSGRWGQNSHPARTR